MENSQLDIPYREFVRKRAIFRVGGCEHCLQVKHDKEKEDGSIFPAWKQLECSHYHKRALLSVRYDAFNGAGICADCHRELENNRDAHTKWFKSHIGEHEYELLKDRMRNMSKIDKEVLWLYYKQKIAELDVELSDKA